MIEVSHLHIRYPGKTILTDASFHIRKGSLTALLGINGSGKSTLLRTLLGMHDMYEGEILIDKKNLKNFKTEEMARKVAVVLTEKPVVSMSVREMVATGRFPYTGRLDRLTDADNNIIRKTMAFTGLTGMENRDITTLSDGELQRVMLARALAQETPCILLDEPFTHLDISHRAEIILLLRKLAREENKTILFSTHHIDFLFETADDFLLLHRQKLIQKNPQEVLNAGILEQMFHHKMLIFDKRNKIFKFRIP